MEAPGISVLNTILKRPVEPRNDALAQRREQSAELQASCQKLVIFMKNMVRNAKQASATDSEALEKKITSLLDDLKDVDGTFLEAGSPVLRHLEIDLRFKDFAKICADFYLLALNLKPLLNENIPDSAAIKALCKEDAFSKLTGSWLGDLEAMLGRVNQEYMKVMALKFSW